MTTKTLKAKIHIACKELGIDNDARQIMQETVTGKASMTDMTGADLQLVVDHLKERGWTPKRGKKKHGLAPRADLRLVHVLWRELGNAGKLEKPGRDGLNAFIRTRFGDHWASVPVDVDALRDHKQINDVITALRQWCARENVVLGQ